MPTPRLVFSFVKAYCKRHGIVIERHGKVFQYWNRREGGGTVGEANTLREAWDDLEDFKNNHFA